MRPAHSNARPATRQHEPCRSSVYPRADTPGCTTQACGIRDRSGEYEAAGATVVGVSPDPVDDVKRFHDKQSLTFTLLADEGHAVAERYGVWGEKSMYGKTYMGVSRSTFLVDEVLTALADL